MGRTTRMGKGEEKGRADDLFSVGETVLVTTNSNRPSIGVIVAMWEVRRMGEEDGGGEEEKIQWEFIGSCGLLSYANRDHFEVDNSDVLRIEDTFPRGSVMDGRGAFYYEFDWEGHGRRALFGKEDDEDSWTGNVCNVDVDVEASVFMDDGGGDVGIARWNNVRASHAKTNT
ncbi:hypothetical protein JAAARDRAFT_80992 [Jaapia argillacea MUCL 33604]|uniref:Uncharacterized protein n=1 Tax=Jaapia argillacea MUCL 33604 TaxID=933084 RepID=A0A067PCS2_9AGAM|nr:hypothetical protein JAAARDRAFT_80992 [Jaapia argillacea MUCL 33604]